MNTRQLVFGFYVIGILAPGRVGFHDHMHTLGLINILKETCCIFLNITPPRVNSKRSQIWADMVVACEVGPADVVPGKIVLKVVAAAGGQNKGLYVITEGLDINHMPGDLVGLLGVEASQTQ